MKKTYTNNQTENVNSQYLTPQISVRTIAVENGFASSTEGENDEDGYGDGGNGFA